MFFTVQNVLAAGCSAERAPAADPEMYIGRISGDGLDQEAALRVAYGRRWTLGGDRAADGRGEFRVPSRSRAVVAYVDSNRNSRLDRFTEPSGDCHLISRAWRCTILRQRVTLHRAITARGDARGDQTIVLWEDFDPGGARVEDSRLCLGRRCTSSEAGPFLSHSRAEVQALSMCGPEGFSPQQAEIRRGGQQHPVRIEQPPSLDVWIRTEQPESPDGELRLHIRNPPCHRALIWGGRVDSKTGEVTEVYWSSEDADIRIAEALHGLEARIPPEHVQRCRRDPDCEIVVQLLRYWSTPGDPLVSATEYRSTVSFRGLP